MDFDLKMILYTFLMAGAAGSAEEPTPKPASGASNSSNNNLSLNPHGSLSPLSISFQLHCLHFIELVRSDQQAEALLYAQNVLSKFGMVRPTFLDVLRV